MCFDDATEINVNIKVVVTVMLDENKWLLTCDQMEIINSCYKKKKKTTVYCGLLFYIL